MQDNNLSNKRGVVSYANHKLEFLTFFEDHKKICDEISGLRFVGRQEDRVVIGKDNFVLGINRVNAFIFQYSYAIKESAKKKHIRDLFEKLEVKFCDDSEYKSLMSKSLANNLSNHQRIIFARKYVDYLIECFDILFFVSQTLQRSLNISTLELLKNLKYLDYEGFYNNLNSYREEVANDLGCLDYNNLFSHYKKILGFFYTYRHLLSKQTQSEALFVFGSIHRSLVEDSYFNRVFRGLENNLSNSDRDVISGELKVYRYWFSCIYEWCNLDLSNKGILPKSEDVVLEDMSLI